MKNSVLSHYQFLAKLYATIAACLIVFPTLIFYTVWWHNSWQMIFMPILGWGLGTGAAKLSMHVASKLALRAYSKKFKAFRCVECGTHVELQYNLGLKVPTCPDCGEQYFTVELGAEHLKRSNALQTMG